MVPGPAFCLRDEHFGFRGPLFVSVMSIFRSGIRFFVSAMSIFGYGISFLYPRWPFQFFVSAMKIFGAVIRFVSARSILGVS